MSNCTFKIEQSVVAMLGRLKEKRMGLKFVKDKDSCVLNSLLPDLSS